MFFKNIHIGVVQ